MRGLRHPTASARAWASSTLDRRLTALVDAAVARAREQEAAEQALRPADPVQRPGYTPMVHGDARRLTIDPTAVVNDALFNVESGTVEVREWAFFGHGVAVLTGTHDTTLLDQARQHGVPRDGRDVVIGRGAWVASRATVIGPCTIGEHAVVGAASLVLSDVPPYTFVAGVPARVVRRLAVPGAPG